VHLDGEPQRLPVYRDAVAAGRLPAGYAVDDGAALVFAGAGLLECVASRPQARVVQVRPDGAGGHLEQEMPIRLLGRAGAGMAGLAGARGGGADPGGSDGISELRALRAGRRRWE
jgi:hypothetical protein